MINKEKLNEVLARREAIRQGDAERVGKQKADGKMTARERIARLLDAGSFVELDALLSRNGDYSGVVTGSGTVQDRPVYVFAQDFTVHGGAMGEMQAQKICKLLDLAAKNPAPVIALCDSAGVRVDEGARAMNAFSRIYAKMAQLSGVCPILSLILGPVVGGAAMMAQLADFSIQAETVGRLMVYGPQVVSAMTGRSVDAAALGGAKAMAAQGGVTFTAVDEGEAIALAIRLLGMLPSSNREGTDLVDSDDLNRLLPDADPDDSGALLSGVSDGGVFMELYPEWGRELRVAMARVGGHSVGLVVSNAQENNGELAPAACAKAARFIRFCDCYDLPVVSLINSRGIQVPDEKAQSWSMITVTQLLYAYAEATTAKVSVIVGNAIGQAFVAMAGKENADITYAWPGSVISALTPQAAVQILCADEMKNSDGDPLAVREALERKFADEIADGIAAASDGMIDDVISPEETRKYIIAALETLAGKDAFTSVRKHGNMPL